MTINMFASGFLENICSKNFLQIVKALVVEIIFSKVSCFRIFFWTHLDGCFWKMKIIARETSYFRHSNDLDIQGAARKSENLIERTFDENT